MSQSFLNETIKLVGVDIFVARPDKSLPVVEQEVAGFKLSVISNRGTKVWPGPAPSIHLTDVFCARFLPANSKTVTHADVLALLGALEKKGFEWVHVEKLLEIRGQPGFSAVQ